MRIHYPRTPHLPWSPGASSDDVRSRELSGLIGREVVVTEKLDGENTTLYCDGLHARSLDSAHHPSRTWLKGLQARIGAGIPQGWRVCGENVYARHSIPYQELESWFYGFSVWDGERCLDWDQTVRFLRRLGIPVPQVLWRGTFDEKAIRVLRLDTARQEGYVVRTVEEFQRAEFTARVAKWVRREHVQTDAHWMHAPVEANGLGPAAAMWAVRSGAAPDVPALLTAADIAAKDPTLAAKAVTDVTARLDQLGRTGDVRLAGVLAALLHDLPRRWLAPRLARTLGMPLARRVADLVGLHAALHRPFPDDDRRSGLVRMSLAVDLGVLHAVAHAALAGHIGPEATEAREQIDWSMLHAEDAGLISETPLEQLRAGLRTALTECDSDAADRCWAEARKAYAQGRIGAADEAIAATWRWRAGDFPRLVHLIGPAGSGKSTFAKKLQGVDHYVCLDELRQARGSRADQRANDHIVGQGMDQLDTALARGGIVVWDATSLNRHQRAPIHAIANRRNALITHAVMLVDEEELARRNTSRVHPVPPQVLAAQLRRFAPPYPGQAHRTWYVGTSGAIDDIDGTLHAQER